MLTTDVVILGAARTPIGKYGGSLRRIHPAELGAVAARAALHRAGVGPEDVDDVWIGHARQAGSGPNPARQVGRRAGLPDDCRIFFNHLINHSPNHPFLKLHVIFEIIKWHFSFDMSIFC